MKIRLETTHSKESPLSFLNSLKAFLKEKLEKGNLDGYSVSMDSETVYDILFAELKDDQISEGQPNASHTDQSPQT